MYFKHFDYFLHFRFLNWIPGRDINRLNIPLEKTELCPALTSIEHNTVRSKHQGQFTKAHFRNTSGRKVNLVFVSDDGKLVQVAALGVDESVSLDTIEGHVFIALDDETGQVLMRHTVGLFYFASNLKGVDSCADERFEELMQHSGPPLECGFINKGFVNLSGCKINVFYFNGTSEELVVQLDPLFGDDSQSSRFAFSSHYEAIYLTHSFFARLPDGKLIEEKRVDRIDIPSCAAAKASSKIDLAVNMSSVAEQLTFSLVKRHREEFNALSAAATINSDFSISTGKNESCEADVGVDKANSAFTNVSAQTDGNSTRLVSVYIPPTMLDLSPFLFGSS